MRTPAPEFAPIAAPAKIAAKATTAIAKTGFNLDRTVVTSRESSVSL
ncbi:MAG TPA: hypothetical protein VGE52_06255 [Pirellulales bacterium]